MLNYLQQFAEEKRCAHYRHLLLLGKIRLIDVPEDLRHGENTWRSIHVIAFRADRARPIEQLKEDIAILTAECALAPDTLFKEMSDMLDDWHRQLDRRCQAKENSDVDAQKENGACPCKDRV